MSDSWEARSYAVNCAFPTAWLDGEATLWPHPLRAFRHSVERLSKTTKNFRRTGILIDIFATVLPHKNVCWVTTFNIYFKQSVTNSEYTAQSGGFIRNTHNVSTNTKTSWVLCWIVLRLTALLAMKCTLNTENVFFRNT